MQEMLADSNPMVVANAVAALAEIQEASGKDVFKVTSNSLFKLLAALNECTEWGQVFILDSLVNYTVRCLPRPAPCASLALGRPTSGLVDAGLADSVRHCLCFCCRHATRGMRRASLSVSHRGCSTPTVPLCCRR